MISNNALKNLSRFSSNLYPLLSQSILFKDASQMKRSVIRQVRWLSKKPTREEYLKMKQRQFKARQKKQNKETALYLVSGGIPVRVHLALGHPSCGTCLQAMGYSTQAVRSEKDARVASMEPVRENPITIRFMAELHSSLKWRFRPQQTEIVVDPGETALAFYTATNPTDQPVVGVSTYTILPYEAALYFNKIQCFCFEDQMLNPHETVDMPVFFYIDPEFLEDPRLVGKREIILNYTFYQAKEGFQVPLPGFLQDQQKQSVASA